MPSYPPMYDPSAIQMQPDLSLLGNRAPPQAPTFGQNLRGLANNPDLALALLANSGYSPQRRTFGEILGNSALQAQGMQQQRQDDAFKRQYMQAQMAAMQAKPEGTAKIQEYQFAKSNGYKGSYEDWVKQSGQTSRPSNVQEWEYFKQLNPDEQRRYLELRRNPNFRVADVMGAPTVVMGTPGGGIQTSSLSSPQQEIDTAAARKGAEAEAGAVGTAKGNITGGIATKGSNATNVLSMTQEARNLLKDSTGSMAGAGVDMLAGSVGISTKGAKAGARLKVLQAGLMLNQPRMEGPQSDNDTLLYKQAAAQVGDTTVPVETRAAALDTIDFFQKKYQERASTVSKPRPRSNASPNVINWEDLK